MNPTATLAGWLVILTGLTLASRAEEIAGRRVHLERVPQNGWQPQACVDAQGRTHLAWLSGDARAANVHYASRPAGSTQWSPPVRVNHTPGSAIAIGTIRGPKLALGREGRVHLCWNGSDQAQPRPAQGGAPLLYTRSDRDGRTFEPERNLLGTTRHLDGGAAVAADPEGRVFLIWHAAPSEGVANENSRAVYLAASDDDGAHFAPQRVISPPGAGACGCCGLQAIAGPAGRIAVLFRAAPQIDQRPATLLLSSDHGASFRPVGQDPWAISQCPMSSFEAQFLGANTLIGAWETAGQIHWQRVATEKPGPIKPRVIAGERAIKHPVIAANDRGETLVAWTVGTGWQRGGSLAWQILDAQDKIIEEGRSDGVPAWGSLAAVAEPGGQFSLWY